VEITYLQNPLYETTNNIYSLWLARDVLTADDTILLESDVIFDPKLIDDLIANPHANVVVVSRFEPWMDGTVTLLDAEDRIVSVVTADVLRLKDAEHYWKTVNVYKLSKSFSEGVYIPFLEAYLKAFGRSRHYEHVLTAITSVSKATLHAHRLESEPWCEIDDVHDLDIAETLFAEGDERVRRYAARHGGYWRFGQLTDFAYLVNPFFPPRALLDELASQIELITRYPSTSRVQSTLAARVFSCEPEEIRVGNGASELLRAALLHLDGPIGVPVPTFEEYLHREVRDHRDARDVHPLPLDLNFTSESLIEASSGLRTLILVQPGNPSGHLLPRLEVQRVLDVMTERGVRVVIDESFLDFAPGEASYIDLIGRYPSLVVIKSIGKTYGVPGLRLGVLATADTPLLTKLDASLPVWNVGSLSELFLQLVTKYRSTYRDACAKLADERERMRTRLSENAALEVFNSHANFLLVRLRDETARNLARRLLEEHCILVKSCTGKIGMPDGEWVRFAVMSPPQNDTLVDAVAKNTR
jgi:histidinol-phosphate/aromatic aminotransferase/cobyric acid decarboxylase-like protein/choline kinase